MGEEKLYSERSIDFNSLPINEIDEELKKISSSKLMQACLRRLIQMGIKFCNRISINIYKNGSYRTAEHQGGHRQLLGGGHRVLCAVFHRDALPEAGGNRADARAGGRGHALLVAGAAGY